MSPFPSVGKAIPTKPVVYPSVPAPFTGGAWSYPPSKHIVIQLAELGFLDEAHAVLDKMFKESA